MSLEHILFSTSRISILKKSKIQVQGGSGHSLPPVVSVRAAGRGFPCLIWGALSPASPAAAKQRRGPRRPLAPHSRERGR